MPYIKTVWQEGQTALGPTNLNKIEQGIADAMAAAEAPLLQLACTLPGISGFGDFIVTDDDTIYIMNGSGLNRVALSTGTRTILNNAPFAGSLVKISDSMLAVFKGNVGTAVIEAATYDVAGNAWTTRASSPSIGANLNSCTFCAAYMLDGKVSVICRGDYGPTPTQYGKLGRWNPLGFVWDAIAAATATTTFGSVNGMAEAFSGDTMYFSGDNTASSLLTVFKAVSGTVTDVRTTVTAANAVGHTAVDAAAGRVFTIERSDAQLALITGWNATSKARRLAAGPYGRCRYFNGKLVIVQDQASDTNIYILPTGGL